MRVGVVLPTKGLFEARGPGADLTWAMLQRAEEAGYAHVWQGDAFAGNPSVSLITLAFIAARSRSIRLGTPLLPPPLRRSARLSGELAMLDQMSEGRLILRVAPGSEPAATDAEATALEQTTGAVPRREPCPEVWVSAGDRGEHVSDALETLATYGDGIIAVDLAAQECVEIRRRAAAALLSTERELGDFPLAVCVSVRPDSTRESAAADVVSSLGRFAIAGVTDLIVRFEAEDQIGELDRFTEEVKPCLELGDLVAAIEERSVEPGWGETPEGLMYLQSIALSLVVPTGLELEVAREHARTFLANFPPMSLPFGDVDQRAARWLAQLLDVGGARTELRRSIQALAVAWHPVAPLAAEQLRRWSTGEPPADPREDAPWFQALVALARTELQT